MPIRYFPENDEEDPAPPPFEPDFSLLENTIATINAMDCPTPFGEPWEG